VVAYGFIYGDETYLSQMEKSFTMVASLVASDTPRQINWHLANARRGGATLEEVRAIREISILVSEKAGVTWKAGVPEIPAEDK
jgi:endoribonuclease Dicer